MPHGQMATMEMRRVPSTAAARMVRCCPWRQRRSAVPGDGSVPRGAAWHEVLFWFLRQPRYDHTASTLRGAAL